MLENYIKILAKELSIATNQIVNTIQLLEEGATIPFIARYRKEKTGSLDEVQIADIKTRLEKLLELDKRRDSVIKSIDEQGKLTDELKDKLQNAKSITEIEDIYLPYKPKRKTRASIAKEKGLEPLAKILMKQIEDDVYNQAKSFINEKVPDVESAIQGACDIIAEWVNENPKARNRIRGLFSSEATIKSKVVKAKAEEGLKYKDYFEFEQKLTKCPSHRILAIRRGEDEGFLKVNLSPEQDIAFMELERIFVKGHTNSSDKVRLAVQDSYKRLLGPSIENEFRNSSKEIADEEAIKVFANNLRQLLLEAPLGQKRILGIDPGYKSGCKIVCLDEQGNLIHNQTIYPHKPREELTMASKQIKTLVNSFKIDAIAIGNGTASRETEQLIKKIRFDKDVLAFVVSEDGASVYSASEIAREEFSQYDLTVRGAVSIGRRLMDPLAELVKIDPKSIGVGQYQHDVEQTKLKDSLTRVVESCVNHVGVNLNTASKHLLTYVSGLGAQLAQNIIDYRTDNGPFQSRKDLKKVTRMGDKAYEQCAGFLRIRKASNPLDNSAVHPESYYLVEHMSRDLKISVSELIKNENLRNQIKLDSYVSDKVGLPTLNDILKELTKPGRDPRDKIQVFEFAHGVHKIEDLEVGMQLPGIVSNITNFGAFVDIGLKQDGLIHISNLANEFVSDPNIIVKLHQHLTVKIVDVDVERNRIQLSLKDVV